MQAIHHIVAAVDLDLHSRKVIEYAAYIADKLGARLLLIHVVESFSTYGEMTLGKASLEELRQNRINQARELLTTLAEPYPASSLQVLYGEIVDGITAFAREKGVEIVVIGTHGSKGLEKLLLGSVAERVVKNAHCPTLVMNPFKQ